MVSMYAGLALSGLILFSHAQHTASESPEGKPKITFFELGSVKCIPCRQMQPVMKAIEEKFGDQVRVIFHDIWQADQRHFAETFRVRVIPTQVFLDHTGKEILRHEGFFPEKEITRFLTSRGLSPKKD